MITRIRGASTHVTASRNQPNPFAADAPPPPGFLRPLPDLALFPDFDLLAFFAGQEPAPPPGVSWKRHFFSFRVDWKQAAQERSGRLFRCGPASLTSVRDGERGDFDLDFVIAEVPCPHCFGGARTDGRRRGRSCVGR